MVLTKLKEQAIVTLRNFKPTGNNDVVNIIETILCCYVEDVRDKNVDQPTGISNEAKFLIEELQSFINGIKEEH